MPLRYGLIAVTLLLWGAMIWVSVAEFLRPQPPGMITTGLGNFGAFLMAQLIAMVFAVILWNLSRPLPAATPWRVIARVPGCWSILSPATIPALILVLNAVMQP